jgi:rod shape-determining protein MreD
LREIAVLFFLVILLEILQNLVFPRFMLVDWSLIAVLYVGWYSPPLKGAVVGILFGLAKDHLFGIYLGLNGLSKTLVGFGGSYLNRLLAPDAGTTRLGLIAILALTDKLVVWGLLLLLGQPVRIFWLDIVVGAALTGVLGELVFQLCDRYKFPPTDFRRL